MIRTAPTRRRGRLGDATDQIVGQTATIASTGVASIAALAAPSVGLITLSTTLAAAIPIAGALIGVGVLIYSLLHNSRGLQQNDETSRMAEKAIAYMQQNLAAWNGSNKSLANQVQALANFDNAWEALKNFCLNGNEGDPGQRCVSERQRGGKYDCFVTLRDPIANDPQAGAIDRAAAQIAAQQTSAQVTSAIQTGQYQPAAPLPPWLIPAAIVAALVIL
jgi:hypothetical protein